MISEARMFMAFAAAAVAFVFASTGRLMGMEQKPLTVCQVLDDSRHLSGRTVTVRGFLNKSPHGYTLYASADGTAAPCPGWRKVYFTAPSILVLMIGNLSNPVLSALHQRYEVGDFSPTEVEVIGRVRRKWLMLIFRMRGGGYAGNGFGQSGAQAVCIEVENIRPVGINRSRP